MSVPIRVRYRMTVDQVTEFSVAMRRAMKSGGRFIAVYVSIVFLIYAGTLCCRQAPGGHGPDWNTIALGVPVIFITLLLLLGLFPTKDTVRKLAEKELRRSPLKDEDYEWSITDQELKFVNRFSESRFQWDLVLRVIETRDCMLMVFADKIVRALPVAGFQSVADLDRFIEIASEKAETYDIYRAVDRSSLLVKEIPPAKA